jgi:ATP/maltotriose-dependent transcriptional regulator MalT/DNA-binding SARP family transcriptional activator
MSSERGHGGIGDRMWRRALSHRLTVVVAGPGWGKSTLLRGLAATGPSIEVTQPPTGWTPFSLARGLLEQVSDTSAEEFPSHTAPDSPDNPEQITALAAGVCATAARAIRSRTLVLLDDADVAPDDPLERFLEALVLNLPPRLHLVLACRRAPTLRIARLRAAGEVAQISADDLAITTDDIRGLELDDAGKATIAEIVRATGGWPLAVRLAAEAIHRGGPLDRAAVVERLLAPDSALFEYLADEVLAGLTTPEQEVLALAAHLPHVSTTLLRDLDRSDLVPRLAPLGEGGVFLEPEPNTPDGYRATLLGGEFLRRSQPVPGPAVLNRAVDALIERGDLESALLLCTRVGDPTLAARVLRSVDRVDHLASPDALTETLRIAQRNGPDPRIAELYGDLQYQRGEWDAALASYTRAGASGDAASPRLARKRGVILYLRGRLDEADEAYAAARLDGTDLAEEAQVLAWRAAMRWVRGDVDECERLIAPAEAAAAASGDDAALATVYTTLAMIAALRADRRTNERSYRKALDHAQRADDVIQMVRIRTNMGSHFMEEGSYPAAIAELDAAIGMAELAGSQSFTGLAYANRGETYTRMGRLDDALRDLRQAQRIWEQLGSDDVSYALAYIGDVQFLRGQQTEARSLFLRSIELAEQCGDMQGLVPALIGLARVLSDDDLPAAAAAAERAISVGQPLGQSHARCAAGWIALRRGDREGARAHAAQALEHAHAQLDRPATAEALLLLAALERPPSVSRAEESGRLWQELGNPIGEARALLLVAETRHGAARADLVSTAERLLFDAGAWRYLADVRRLAAEPAMVPRPVAINTLGGFRVTRGGVPIEVGDWGSRKARDLVKLLVARRGAPVVREEVTELLWPDETDRSARRLSVLLSTIRSVLDPRKEWPADHFVAADHDSVWLVREHVEVDVEQFLTEASEGRRLLAAGHRDKGAEVLAQAAARYLGDFCADDPYADWAAGPRELARHMFVETARFLGELAEEDGEHSEALRHRLRILDVDPYDEIAHLDLIRSLRLQRRHGEARRAYRTYCVRLGELDLDPAPFPG